MMKEKGTSFWIKAQHREWLDFLDHLENGVRELGMSPFPQQPFERHRDRLADFFHYMDSLGISAMRSLEENLLPAVSLQLQEPELSGMSFFVEEIRDHYRSIRSFYRRVKARFLDLVGRPSQESAAYHRFCTDMLDLVGLCRRQVWKEDCVLLPMLEDLLTDEELSQIWQTPAGPVDLFHLKNSGM